MSKKTNQMITELIDAFRVVLRHAEEKHPHFESERGQRDIANGYDVIVKAEVFKNPHLRTEKYNNLLT